MEIISNPVAKSRKARLSKNRQKKSWRKFSNVDDVEDFLDEQRRDARSGGPVYEKKDSELFVIDDVAPETPIQESSTSRKPSDISVWKELKCFKGMSGDRGPELRKPHVNKSREVYSTSLKRSADLFAQQKPERKRFLENQAELKKTETESGTKRGTDPVFNRDLWSTDSEKNKVAERQAAIAKPVRLPPTLRLKKASGFAAVEFPHPGTSYNPSEEDHANLLAVATSKAVKAAAAETRLAVFSKHRKSDKSAADVWMEEMEEGLPNTETGRIGEEEVLVKREVDEDDSDADILGAIGKERKTKKIRKREQLQDEKTKKRIELKKKKLRDNEVYSVKKIMKEIRTKEAKNKEKSLLRKAKIDDPKRVKKLGKIKYDEPDVDVKLKEDIADNLRLLKPEGSIFSDRYKSLQKRNILEPRSRQRVKRKYKLKQYQIEGRKMEDA